MLYVYSDADTIKLHDCIEVVGILSHVPELAAMHMGKQPAGSLFGVSAWNRALLLFGIIAAPAQCMSFCARFHLACR